MSERSGPKRTGRPLVALMGVLLCWVGARAALFELPPDWEARSAPFMRIAPDFSSQRTPTDIHQGRLTAPLASWTAPAATEATPPRAARSVAPLHAPPPLPLPPDRSPPAPPRTALGHNLLWMAAMNALPLPPELAMALERARPPAPSPTSARVGALPRPSRWRGEAWLLIRDGATGIGSSGPAAPIYGGSQAGAVVRYQLAPASAHRPAAYVRAVHALAARGETDLAAGFAARPVARLPVTAHLEVRASRRGSADNVRPAAFVTTGVDAVPLPAGLSARGYAQAGYVGGAGATPFADGTLVAERVMARGRDATFAAGAGLWGGAQRGSARLDIGPSASLRFSLGESAARLSLDYRLRVAGNAAPAAGAALTLSAGF